MTWKVLPSIEKKKTAMVKFYSSTFISMFLMLFVFLLAIVNSSLNCLNGEKNTIKLLKAEKAKSILNCLTYQKKKNEQLLHLLYFSNKLLNSKWNRRCYAVV